MLFDEPVLYFRGLTIYRDFSNEEQYYFLPPSAPRIARSPENPNNYAMRLVLYRPDPNAPAPQGFENGGGFLNLDVDLAVSENTIEEATEEVRHRFGGRANLVPVPFISGTVELVLLGVGREDEGQPFVRKVAGSTIPSLYDTNRAAFSVVLDRDGAALMQQVIREGGATMALAIYHLTYAGIGPAYNLKITVDYQRVFEQLDLRLRAAVDVSQGRSSFVGKAGFHMLMEELRESRAIIVEETDPIPGENGRTPVDQARIDEIISNLMGAKWFRPTLAQAAQMADLGAGGTSATESGAGAASGSGSGSSGDGRRAATWTEDSKTPVRFPADRGVGPFAASPRGTKETLTIRGEGATAKVGESASSLQAASISNGRLEVEVPANSTRHLEIKWPAVPAGTSGSGGQRQPATWTPVGQQTSERGVDYTPSASGTEETLTIRGERATAKVGDSATSLQPVEVSGGRIQVDVGNGQTKHVEITWPGGEARQDTFHLFFDYERPRDDADKGGYVGGTPSPAEGTGSGGDEDRFLPLSRAKSTESAASPRGPAALQAWLGNIQPGATLELFGHASYEGRDSEASDNLALSRRRREVAQALIPSSFTTTHIDRGHADSKDDQTSPTTPTRIPVLTGDTGVGAARAGGSPGRLAHRVVIIKGQVRGAAGQVLRGTLHRPQPGPGGTPPPAKPECTLKGHFHRPADGSGESSSDPTVKASFEINLEMIEREERLTATYELNTRKARTQPVHPQGQLILDAINPEDYVLEADGAIDFFQWLDVRASTTAQWEADGISAIHVQFRYAPRDGGFRRAGEVALSAGQATGGWKVGVLHAVEGDNRSPVLYKYQYRVTVHYLPDVALGDQSGAVTSVGIEGADAEGWIDSTERNLVIHPREVTPAITVNVTTGIMRFDLLQRAQVVLTYGPYRQNITLSAEAPNRQLVIRPEEGLEDAVLRTEGTLFYKDGAQVKLRAEEWQSQELIVINEPRENILRVDVLLADPGDIYERVNARLKYEHANRVVEETFELRNHAEMKNWAVRLEDAAHREWQYQATLVKKAGDIDTIEWTDGEGGQLILGVQAADVIPVQVTLLDLPSGDFQAVKVDLQYEDRLNGVDWRRSELIRGDHSGMFDWPIAIVNPRLRAYRYKVTEFHRSGRKETDWIESSETQLVLERLP
ncbi:MAG: hypothetical protein AB7I44_19645 [Hyphomicrobiaceae bacterium]